MLKSIQLLDADKADKILDRMAYEMYEHNIGESGILMAGIADRGLDIAKLLKKKIEKISDLKVEVVSIRINKDNPIDPVIMESTDLADRSIILVDDVANSGKTIMYALKPFLAQVVRKMQVAVLIDRKHKRYPVSSDYVGLQLSTALQEHIIVSVEKGKVTGATLS
ncbi:MAG: phosphoribosyltransferase [Chitinophagaceae bacterium]|nr:phosphoribosyltransferase [Chitinophagaceae bacterium]